MLAGNKTALAPVIRWNQIMGMGVLRARYTKRLGLNLLILARILLSRALQTLAVINNIDRIFLSMVH